MAEINRLLKQHRQMQDAFKFMAKDGGKGFARMAGSRLGGGGMDRLKAMGGGRLPAAAAPRRPAARPRRPARPPNLPGLGASAPRPNTCPAWAAAASTPSRNPEDQNPKDKTVC